MTKYVFQNIPGLFIAICQSEIHEPILFLKKTSQQLVRFYLYVYMFKPFACMSLSVCVCV